MHEGPDQPALLSRVHTPILRLTVRAFVGALRVPFPACEYAGYPREVFIPHHEQPALDRLSVVARCRPLLQNVKCKGV